MKLRSSIIAITMALGLSMVSGCGMVDSTISSMKGQLIGNAYTISSYDAYGNKVLTAVGDKVHMENGVDSSGADSSYIDIFIDGHEWNHVGNTLVFAQDGVDIITEFDMDDIENIGGNSQASSGLMAVDRTVNHYKNLFGKKLVVLISSQNGVPIMLIQGDKCYTEIPEDLPKTTKLSIDGKLVYIYRATVDILPAKLIK